MTDNIEIQKINDQMAKSEAEANKIKFRMTTLETIDKLAKLKTVSKKVETHMMEKELDGLNEKVEQESYVPTEKEIKRIAALEIYLEFMKDGVVPTNESIDKKVEIVSSRAIKVKEEMKEGMFENRRAILAHLNGVVPLEKEDQQMIEGLIEEQAKEEAEEATEEVIENAAPPVEEVEEEPKEDLEEKIEDKYIDLDVSGEENLKTGLTEEEVQSVQEEAPVEYTEVDATEESVEEQVEETTPVEENTEEHEEAKEEAPEEENKEEDKDDFNIEDVEIEELLKESEDIKKRISEVADKRKAKEEEKAKAQKENEEALHEKEMRDKALKEAIAKYREQLNKDREKLEKETKSLEEEEKGIQELGEKTQAIKDQTKKMNKTIELLSGKTEEKAKKK